MTCPTSYLIGAMLQDGPDGQRLQMTPPGCVPEEDQVLGHLEVEDCKVHDIKLGTCSDTINTYIQSIQDSPHVREEIYELVEAPVSPTGPALHWNREVMWKYVMQVLEETAWTRAETDPLPDIQYVGETRELEEGPEEAAIRWRRELRQAYVNRVLGDIASTRVEADTLRACLDYLVDHPWE